MKSIIYTFIVYLTVTYISTVNDTNSRPPAPACHLGSASSSDLVPMGIRRDIYLVASFAQRGNTKSESS